MLINNTNINAFNAKQLTVDIQAGELNNSSIWSKNFLTPIFFDVNTAFSILEVKLLIDAENREDCLIQINNIIALSIRNKENIVSLDGYKKTFVGTLIEHKEEKTIIKNKYYLTLKFNGYFEGEEHTETIISNKTINNKSTTKTPCKITLTSTADIAAVTIKISNRQITINNITKDTSIVLNGLTGEFTENNVNKFNDIDLWELPYLDTGINTINCSNNTCTLEVTYKDRYI